MRHEEFRSTIHLPAAGLDAPETDVSCHVVTIDGRRMHLELLQAIPVSVPLIVEHQDSLYLGEVVDCHELGSRCEVDIEVEYVLTGLQSLAALRARLLED
jgi:hypothetical protein